MTEAIANRYDFVLLFDVHDGNPNGDPDAGNLPRLDAETGHGLVTDVCLKRKLRNFVQIAKGLSQGFDIFVKEKAILNTAIGYACDETKGPGDGKSNRVKHVDPARQKMCSTFYDVRAFGAVMTTGKNAGQVRGPVQLTFARSVDQVFPIEHAITRLAVTTEAEAVRQKGMNRTMARKFTIPYALYRCHGFVSAPLAAQTGFDAEDLELLWEALASMFEHDRSAARGQMATRKLVVFRHESRLGNAAAHRLFDTVTVRSVNQPPRRFSDYEVTVPGQSEMPPGITVVEKVG